MKKYVFAALFAGAVLLAGGCASKPSPRVDITSKPADVGGRAMVQDLHKREVEATKWLAALQQVAEKTTDAKTHQRVDDILQMFVKRGVVVVPTENGMWIPPFADDKDSVRIIVLTPSDRKLGAWKKYFEKSSGVMFTPEYRGVVIKTSDPISVPFMGFTLGHEGNHLLNLLNDPKKNKTVKEVCEAERDTYEFEGRLLASYAGYKQFATAEAFLSASSVKQTANGAVFSWRGKHHEELDSIFGPALSEYEKKGREMLTWIDIIFRAIDGYYAVDQEAAKAEFICGVYKDKGILPKE